MGLLIVDKGREEAGGGGGEGEGGGSVLVVGGGVREGGGLLEYGGGGPQSRLGRLSFWRREARGSPLRHSSDTVYVDTISRAACREPLGGLQQGIKMKSYCKFNTQEIYFIKC